MNHSPLNKIILVRQQDDNGVEKKVSKTVREVIMDPNGIHLDDIFHAMLIMSQAQIKALEIEET